MLAHMGNWEWLAEVQHSLDEGITEVNVYRQLKNPKMDALMLAIRAQRGGTCVEKRRILREMVRFRAEKKKVTIGLICDQKPRPEVTRTWVDFLHQDTGFLDGGEVLGTKFGYPVFYAYVRRPKRGCYEAEVQLLTADPKSCAEGEITKAYAQALERNILEQPELWLWTHNRWKWKREK
jgi:KDO2-lipid IV(A) lauroyltransferase